LFVCLFVVGMEGWGITTSIWACTNRNTMPCTKIFYEVPVKYHASVASSDTKLGLKTLWEGG